MTITTPWQYPTLLCTPPWKYEGMLPTETTLPLEPEAYAVSLSAGSVPRVATHSHPIVTRPAMMLRTMISFSRSLEKDGAAAAGWIRHGAIGRVEARLGALLARCPQ